MQAAVRPIPHDRRLESSLALLLDGYEFIARRCRRMGSDVFRTRLMLRDTISAGIGARANGSRSS